MVLRKIPCKVEGWINLPRDKESYKHNYYHTNFVNNGNFLDSFIDHQQLKKTLFLVVWLEDQHSFRIFTCDKLLN
jgi:hypothetical protein